MKASRMRIKRSRKKRNAPVRDIPLPRGVLRIKRGYNPNSSSIGTVVYSFPYAFIAVSAVLTVLSAFLTKRKKDD